MKQKFVTGSWIPLNEATRLWLAFWSALCVFALSTVSFGTSTASSSSVAPRAALVKQGGFSTAPFDASLPLAQRSTLEGRLVGIAQLQIAGPCITSLIGTATQSCIQWQPNVDAAASYHASTRRFFSGAGDELLHVLDADTLATVAQIVTIGRVITESVFSRDGTMLFVGTDKGFVLGIDAFSFKRVFSFAADSKINNNLTFADDALVFTSSIGTIYSIDQKTGEKKWSLEQPLASERLKLASESTIHVFEDIGMAQKESSLVVPHADGYVSIVRAKTGELKKQVKLGTARPNGFPDIVAPMIWLKNKLWIASFDLGLFAFDIFSGRIHKEVPLKEIVQLSTDGKTLYAASSDVLYAIEDNGEIQWKNNLFEIKSRALRVGYPFEHFRQGGKRIFFGLPSRLLVNDTHIIFGTSIGSLGIFNKMGQLEKIAGNSVGFGPKINWAGPEHVVAVSKRGLLMKFQLYRNQQTSSRTSAQIERF